jgi:hypothetical protein
VTRSRSLPILLTLALAIFAAPSAQTSTPREGAPRTAAKVDEIKAWVELHKGLGSPDFLEAHVRDLHVFAAWNIPTSGLNTTYYWVYCRRAGAWTLLKASSFQPAEDQTRYALVDPVKRELRFVGPKEENFETVSVAACGE